MFPTTGGGFFIYWQLLILSNFPKFDGALDFQEREKKIISLPEFCLLWTRICCSVRTHPVLVAFSNSFCILASRGWSLPFSSEVFWLERERIANVLCLVHIFFLSLYSSRVTLSLNLFIFSWQFQGFALLSVGPEGLLWYCGVCGSYLLTKPRAAKQASQLWWRWGKPAVFQVC